MSKAGIVSLAMSILGAALLGWATLQISRIGTRLDEIDAKIVASEGSKSGGGVSGAIAGSGAAEKLSDDVVKLKSQLQDLKVRLEKIAGGMTPGTGPTLADLSQALDEAIARIEKRRRVEGAIADAKRAQAHNEKVGGSLSRDLQLSDSQKAEVGEVLKAQVERYRELWIEGGEPGSSQAKLQAINDDTAGKIRALLNEEQRKRLDMLKLKWYLE